MLTLLVATLPLLINSETDMLGLERYNMKLSANIKMNITLPTINFELDGNNFIMDLNNMESLA